MIKVFFDGYAGGDGELRYTAKGDPVCSFSVGVQQGYGDNKYTIWVRCTAWGKQGEALAGIVKKGSPVSVVGDLTGDKDTGNPRTYTKKDGKTGASFEVKVDQCDVHGGKPKDDSSGVPAATEEDVPF
jgi:single-strand DNA-binding protein